MVNPSHQVMFPMAQSFVAPVLSPEMVTVEGLPGGPTGTGTTVALAQTSAPVKGCKVQSAGTPDLALVLVGALAMVSGVINQLEGSLTFPLRSLGGIAKAVRCEHTISPAMVKLVRRRVTMELFNMRMPFLSGLPLKLIARCASAIGTADRSDLGRGLPGRKNPRTGSA